MNRRNVVLRFVGAPVIGAAVGLLIYLAASSFIGRDLSFVLVGIVGAVIGLVFAYLFPLRKG